MAEGRALWLLLSGLCRGRSETKEGDTKTLTVVAPWCGQRLAA
eukprot:COSAG01_NODE_37459_length_503_cov_0.878713_1_plen_42_part_10